MLRACPQDESAVNHFLDARAVASLQSLADERFVFGFKFNRHSNSLSPQAQGVNPFRLHINIKFFPCSLPSDVLLFLSAGSEVSSHVILSAAKNLCA